MAILRTFAVDRVQVRIYDSKTALGDAAAADAGEILRAAIACQGRARIIVGTGNSQNEVIAALCSAALEWSAIEVFHMDEYAGIPEDHPASFRRWLRTHLVEHVHPGAAHYVRGDAPDLEQECRRYAALLAAAPIDITFFGIGENGHIAFNEPGQADFADPRRVKRVVLDDRSRRQQVGEGHFPSLEAVPREALTITCPVIAESRYLIGCVPDERKAEAVRRTLEGPVGEECPATLIRRHPAATVYLDPASASRLAGDRR